MDKRTKTYKMLNKFGLDTISKMKIALNNGGKSDSRFIKKLSFYMEEDEDGIIELFLEFPQYGVFIDKGRKPYKGSGSMTASEVARVPMSDVKVKLPPQTPIRNWMRRKGIRPDKEFIIRKGISVRGIKPVPFLDIWFKRVLGLNDILLTAMVQDYKTVISEYIKKIND